MHTKTVRPGMCRISEKADAQEPIRFLPHPAGHKILTGVWYPVEFLAHLQAVLPAAGTDVVLETT